MACPSDGWSLASGPIRAHNPWESPTEGEALGHVLYEMLRTMLTPKEDVLLALFLLGYWNKEAGKLLGLSRKEVRCAREALQRKVVALTDPDGVAASISTLSVSAADGAGDLGAAQAL